MVVALTERGRELLDDSGRDRDGARQAFYAGFVKPRELTHDVQVYRAYLRAAERLRRGLAFSPGRPRLRAEARLPEVPPGLKRERRGQRPATPTATPRNGGVGPSGSFPWTTATSSFRTCASNTTAGRPADDRRRGGHHAPLPRRICGREARGRVHSYRIGTGRRRPRRAVRTQPPRHRRGVPR